MGNVKGVADERASPDEFIVLHEFMMKGLGLSGIPLLVYARIYGFNAANLDFYESKSHLASFLGTTERSVYRAFSDLMDRGLVREDGTKRHIGGVETKRYEVIWDSIPERARGPDPDKTSPPDKTSSPEILSGAKAPRGDETSGRPLKNCQPIRKADNKAFG